MTHKRDVTAQENTALNAALRSSTVKVEHPEIASLRAEISTAEAFHKVAVAERDYERQRADILESATIKALEDRDRLRAELAELRRFRKAIMDYDSNLYDALTNSDAARKGRGGTMRCPQCGQKECCGADMSPEIERLTAELAECRAAASDAAHMLEIARVWGGLDWSWTNLHHSIAKCAWEKLTDALAAKEE